LVAISAGDPSPIRLQEAYDFGDMSQRLILVCPIAGGLMADDSTVASLQEIRDLQKKHTELLQAFVEGQQQGLTNQKQARANQQQVAETKTGVGPVDSVLGIRAGWSIPVATLGFHSHCFQPIQNLILGH
jgi:hypothetical protein